MNEEVKQQIRKGRVRKNEEQPQEVSSNSQEVSPNPQETPQEKLVKSGREVRLSNGLTVTYH
jgi:hypothetical protein